MRSLAQLKRRVESRVGRCLLAALAGGLLPLGLAPFHVWPLALVSAGGLFWVLRGAGTGWQAFAGGWCFGVGKYGVGASWIYVSIHVYGPTPAALAVALVAIFVVAMAVLVGAGGWLFHRLRIRAGGGGWFEAGHFAWVWVATEWTLTWLLTGFPWLFAGYGFDAASTLAVKVLAAAHSGSSDLTTSSLSVAPSAPPGVTVSRASLSLDEEPGADDAN